MAFGFDFLSIMQVIGTLTTISIILYLLNTKRDFNGVWTWFVVLPIYLILLEFPKGNWNDIFFDPAWSLEVAVIVAIVAFFLLGFKFPVKDGTIILLVAGFIALQLVHLTFWANMIGVVFYLLFSYLFISSGITTLKHWFSDAP